MKGPLQTFLTSASIIPPPPSYPTVLLRSASMSRINLNAPQKQNKPRQINIHHLHSTHHPPDWKITSSDRSGSGFLTYTKGKSQNMSPGPTPGSHTACLAREAAKTKTWLKLWIPKAQLNLALIISAPAAKGNFSTSPHNSHHFWGLVVAGTHLKRTSPKVWPSVKMCCRPSLDTKHVLFASSHSWLVSNVRGKLVNILIASEEPEIHAWKGF